MRNKEVTCPFCEKTFPENCEYVDIGVGFQQCSPNFCEYCYAGEVYPDDSRKDDERSQYKDGWRKLRDEKLG